MLQELRLYRWGLTCCVLPFVIQTISENFFSVHHFLPLLLLRTAFAGGFFGFGGGAVVFPVLGGTALIRHLGPEPIKSSL